MTEIGPKQSRNPLWRVWGWAKNQLVGDVPEDIAICAMDCRKGQCTLGEWEKCERRLHKGAGELMPAQEETPLEEDPDTEANTREPMDQAD